MYERRFKYVMPLDVVQFFPSIDHSILRRILARAIADPDVLALIDVILQSGAGVLVDAYDMVWFAGDDVWAALRPRGLPIGNLTSQFWANVYLNEFDQFAKRRLKAKRDQVQAGALSPEAYRASLLAWIAHAQHGDTWGLRRAVFGRLTFRESFSS
ncbi:MAG: RNA-directed DNA polymerase [Anaerolineae bacterium]